MAHESSTSRGAAHRPPGAAVEKKRVEKITGVFTSAKSDFWRLPSGEEDAAQLPRDEKLAKSLDGPIDDEWFKIRGLQKEVRR